MLALLPSRQEALAAFSMEAGEVTLLFWQARQGQLVKQTWAAQNRRWAVHRAVRAFFAENGFLEVDTPVRVLNPGMEPFLDTFSAEGMWLRTSPELHMKRLLAAGFDRIFQIAPSFRKGDHSRLHREEFLMLEWYRRFADLEDLLRDCQELLVSLAPFSSDSAYFSRPLERLTCAEAWERHTGHPLARDWELSTLRHLATKNGIHFTNEDDWDTLYFRIFLNLVEPNLGWQAPTALVDFPASQAALAKEKSPAAGVFPTCFRLELYLRGRELANAFYELTEPVVQRERWEKDILCRKSLGKPLYEPDENFLKALACGIPPSAGIALGLDRLVLCLLDGSDLSEILPFP
jgi:lysyl-tRNA synthetase class 2